MEQEHKDIFDDLKTRKLTRADPITGQQRPMTDEELFNLATEYQRDLHYDDAMSDNDVSDAESTTYNPFYDLFADLDEEDIEQMYRDYENPNRLTKFVLPANKVHQGLSVADFMKPMKSKVAYVPLNKNRMKIAPVQIAMAEQWVNKILRQNKKLDLECTC